MNRGKILQGLVGELDDTIAAIGTPMGRGGIGIVRLSGSKAVEIADKLFKAKCGKSVDQFTSHKLYYGHIINPDKKTKIDEGLLVLMKAPHSYTKEDVVELQMHSGPLVLKWVLEKTMENGARLALPGEFTKRAFLNGRIDLTQAEAVADLINAKSITEIEIQNSKLEGLLAQIVEGIIEKINKIMVELEGEIEFEDQIGMTAEKKRLGQILEKDIKLSIQGLIKSYKNTKIYTEGVKVAICGLPNVGKSTLLNRLLEKEKAIVTGIPGTTRDLIEDFILLEQVPFFLTDTAGIKEAEDEAEKIGIEKAVQAARKADLILLVIDSNEPRKKAVENLKRLYAGKKIITVWNKIDLLPKNQKLERYKGPGKVELSAKEGIGIEELKKMLVRYALEIIETGEFDGIAPNIRQKIRLENCVEYINNAILNLKNEAGHELVIIDLQDAIGELYGLLGKEAGKDVLEDIFAKFCIGK